MIRQSPGLEDRDVEKCHVNTGIMSSPKYPLRKDTDEISRLQYLLNVCLFPGEMPQDIRMAVLQREVQ